MAFSFIQITDHHLTESETVLTHGFSTNYAFRMVTQHLSAHIRSQADLPGVTPRFIVSTGDLGEMNPLEGYRSASRILRTRVEGVKAPGPVPVTIDGAGEMPMYFLPGNHDDLASMLQHFFPGNGEPAQADGDPERLNLWFEHDGVRFVCLDWGRDARATSTPAMFDFLASALEDRHPVVILTHHHVVPIGVAWLDAFVAGDIDRFWEIVRGKKVLGILAGHVHMTTEHVVEGIPVMTLRSTAFQFARQERPLLTLEPPHYRLVTIDGDVLTSRVFEVRL
jgi:3',5'-cyclic AMP phosphodiesterase CpdA